MFSRRIKILFLIDQLGNAGGTEKQLILLAEGLPRQIFEPVIGVLQNNNCLANANFKTLIVDFNRSGLPFLKNAPLWKRLRHYIAKSKFDIVQTHFIDSAILGTLAARLCKSRPLLIGTRRNLYHWVKDEPWTFRSYRFTARWADRILVNSHSVFNKCKVIERIPTSKRTLIQNGVEINKYDGVTQKAAKRKIGLKGRVSRYWHGR